MGSGFKSSLYACLHLMPDWMRRVTDDYKEEACGVREWGLHLLEKQGRAAVWAVSAELGVRAPGVAALACRLVERYLYSQMRHFESRQIQRFQQGLRSRIPALIASCVQIAAKSNSAAISLSASQVCSYLFRQGVHHSVKDVVTWEYHVFQTIDYRVPLWTSVEVAELLAVQARLPPTLLEPLGIVVNLAEYKRDRLDRRVRWVANVSPHSSNSSSCDEPSASARARALTVRTAHLAAGAVAACARYFGRSRPTLELHLASYINVPLSYVECLRDSILTEAIIEDTHDVCKRRRSLRDSILAEAIMDDSYDGCKRRRYE
ncbi:uncharacterized protein LOC134754050 [Cydia strobilella]|uniref:uncharacterized protein LOC134754050 n=1 Tax=Cydia strobilella TaxID=1100964 RepID=UPI00300746A4